MRNARPLYPVLVMRTISNDNTVSFQKDNAWAGRISIGFNVDVLDAIADRMHSRSTSDKYVYKVMKSYGYQAV